MMNKVPVIRQIVQIAEENPDSIAIEGGVNLTYSHLIELIKKFSEEVQELSATSFAIDLDNGPEWAVLDLALLDAGKILTPLPAFFSDRQVRHLLTDAGVELLFTTSPERFGKFGGTVSRSFDLCGIRIYQVHFNDQSITFPAGTAKVTYTSGTTGEPKGVCISSSSMRQVALSIAKRAQVTSTDRHFISLPLTTLLENIGGLYATLMTGATAVIRPQHEIGLSGATGIEPTCFIQSMEDAQATTTILIPQMLDVLVNGIEFGFGALDHMRFIAVGGAPLSSVLLERADRMTLPVYEGYGLSEAVSVVAVNGPGNRKTGSVGKPLSHVDLQIADDGEVYVHGALFNGYLGESHSQLTSDGYLATGDVGEIDGDGFLTLLGRKKNMFITSFGRNVAPEWVERELTIHPDILQAAIFGESRPWNVAVIVVKPGADIEEAMGQANERLPDYAQISRWITADIPFTVENGQWTGSARPRREVIWGCYGERIEKLYTLAPTG